MSLHSYSNYLIKLQRAKEHAIADLHTIHSAQQKLVSRATFHVKLAGQAVAKTMHKCVSHAHLITQSTGNKEISAIRRTKAVQSELTLPNSLLVKLVIAPALNACEIATALIVTLFLNIHFYRVKHAGNGVLRGSLRLIAVPPVKVNV